MAAIYVTHDTHYANDLRFGHDHSITNFRSVFFKQIFLFFLRQISLDSTINYNAVPKTSMFTMHSLKFIHISLVTFCPFINRWQ